MAAPISANASISTKRLRISSRLRPSSRPLRMTLSLPEYAGLKPLPSSRRPETRPLTFTSPLVGVFVPHRMQQPGPLVIKDPVAFADVADRDGDIRHRLHHVRKVGAKPPEEDQRNPCKKAGKQKVSSQTF